MSLTVKRDFIANNAGQKIILNAEEIKQETLVSFVCDSPRHDARGLSKKPVSWIEEEAVADINSLPDPFFTIVKLQPFPTDVQKTYYFCSPGCCKDWLTYGYKAPELPRVTKERLKVTAETQAALDAQNQMELPFDTAPQIETHPDATGDSDAVESYAQPV